MSHSNRPIKPSRGWYLVSGIILFIGVGVVPVGIFVHVFNQPEPVQFLAPGTLRSQITSPGRQVLWYNYEALFEGKTFSNSDTIPEGMQIKLTQFRSTNEISMVPFLGTRSQSNGSKRRTVAMFEIASPGEYELSVQGNFPQRVLSLGQDEMAALAKGALVGSSVAGLSLLGAPCLAISTFLRRRKAKQLLANHAK